MKTKTLTYGFLLALICSCQQTVDPFEVPVSCPCSIAKKVFFNDKGQYIGGYRYTYDNSGNIAREEGLSAADSTTIDPNNFTSYTYSNSILSLVTKNNGIWKVTNSKGLFTKVEWYPNLQISPSEIYKYTYSGNDLTLMVHQFFNANALIYSDSIVFSDFSKGRSRNVTYYNKNFANSLYQKGNKDVLTYDSKNSLVQFDEFSSNGVRTWTEKWAYDFNTKPVPPNSFFTPYTNPNFNSADKDSFFQSSDSFTSFCGNQTDTDIYLYQVISKNQQGYPTKKSSAYTFTRNCNAPITNGSYSYFTTYYYNCCKK